MAGPTAGRRVAFDQAVVTFGRDAGSDLAVGEAFVSRHHCELRFEDGRWLLHNLSPNGTQVNRRKVTKQPRPVQAGDEVAVGGRPLFRIVDGMVQPTGGGEDGDDAAGTGAATGGDAAERISGRGKLWIGIGIYFLAVIVVMLVVGGLIRMRSGDQTTAPGALRPDQIRAAIMQLPPAPAGAPDPARSAAALELARQHYAQRDQLEGNRYKAYDQYQQALVWAGREHFDAPADVQDYLQVQQELIALVERQYQEGYSRLSSGQYAEADRTFARLAAAYPAHGGPIMQAVERHRRVAQQRMDKRRR